MKITKAGIALLLWVLCSPLLVKCQSTSGQPRLIIPFGHHTGILYSLFSHDDKMLITADEKMTIVSDVRSGKPLYYLQGTGPAISVKDSYIATFVDSSVMVWNADDGLLVNSLKLSSKVGRISFHPVTNLLMVERLAENSNGDDGAQFYHAAVWDVKQQAVQHEFLSVLPANGKGGDPCEMCKSNGCPISAAWFTGNGDSIRIVHPGFIRTYALNNYQSGRDVCLATNDKHYGLASVRILNNHTIGLYQEQSANFFNEYGQPVGSWTKKTNNEGPNREVSECISPAYDYLASYTSRSIYLYNLKAGTLRYYNVDNGHVKKLTFNRSGTLILVEFLNEAPRIMTSVGFTVPKSFKPADFEGLAKYVYETKTVQEASNFTGSFEAAAAGAPKPRRTLFGKVMTEGLGVPDPRSTMMDGVLDIMVNGVNIAFTNSGEIVDLATRRPISKIQSLIKLSGDVRLSPDKNLLLLNTGSVISVYSIPYSKVLVNLKPFTDNVFSPDSRWLVQHFGGMKMNLVDLTTGLMDSVSLNLPSWPFNSLAFTADSRRVIIGSGKGGSVIVDIATKKIVQEAKDRSYYVSADGLKYGVIDHKAQMAYIHSIKDSARLYSLSLAGKAADKSDNNSNNKSNDKRGKNNKDNKSNKDNKGSKKNDADEGFSVANWQISFAQDSDAFAIWMGGSLQFIKDISKPNEVILYEGELGSPISRVTISANSKYLNIQPQVGNNIIFNVQTKESFQPIDNKEQEDFNFGAMFSRSMSGNLESILRGRDMAQFSVTGDSVLVCNGDAGYIYDCLTGKRLHSFKVEGEIKYFSLANNVVISNYYGQLRFQTLPDMKEWFSMLPFTNGEMVFLLPNGIYSGSKSATRHLGYMQDAKSLSYKQFDYSNNRPDIVMRALGNTDVEYLARYDSLLALRRRREGLSEVSSSVAAKAPQVSIVNEKNIMGEVKQKVLPLQLSIKTFEQYPDRLAVYINGNPMAGGKGIRLSRKGYSIDTTIQVTLTQGNNNIEVSVFDASGAESFRQPLYVQLDSVVDRKLYFMGIGVSKYQASGNNLVYAQKDVKDVLDSLRKQYGPKMVVDTFFNQQVTLENLRKLKGKFSKTQPDDIVVIYYSGHGIMDGNRPEAYFGTYDVDFKNPSKRGISFNDFNDLLENIPSRNKVIFLDACHSGEINKEEGASPMRRPGETDPFDLVLELFTDHYQGNGSNVIVAARGKEAAKECESIRLGVFTYTVLKGLTLMTADEDSNAVLSIGELQNYITRNVIGYSTICRPKIVQRAGIRKENEYNDWAVLRNGSATFGLRSAITETTEPRPLVSVIRSTRDTLSYYKNTAQVLTDKNSSVEDKVKAAKEVIARNIPSFLKKKDNASWLQKYQKQKNKHTQLLAEEAGFSVKYEKVNRGDVDYIIFDITSKYVIPSLRVDVNTNKEMDACMDRVFTKAEGDVIQIQYMLAGETCQGKAPESGAAMYATADQYLFMVPVAELSSTLGYAQVNFILHSNMGKDPVSWPVVSAEKIFEKYYEVKW